MYVESAPSPHVVWEKDVCLESMNTFNIKASARYLVRVKGADVQNLIGSSKFRCHRHLIIGLGSNILLTKPRFDGIVIKNEIAGIELIDKTGHCAFLRVGAGVLWDSLVSYCLDNDLGGIENLRSIPGSVGAASVQNIGAYGAEVSQVITSVEAVDLRTGQLVILSNAECEFGYRDSIFKHTKSRHLVTQVVMKVTTTGNHRINAGFSALKGLGAMRRSTGPSALTIQSVAAAVAAIRQEKLPDPQAVGNAGSFFKNCIVDQDCAYELKKRFADIPLFEKSDGSRLVPAAWMVEKCGWRGKRFGSVGVYTKHTLILVNHGGATGADVLKLSQDVTKDVKALFHISLTPEVILVI